MTAPENTATEPTLTDFLLARIGEDEAVAQAAVGTAVFDRQTGKWSFESVRTQFGEFPIVFALTESGAKTQAADLSSAWEQQERGAHIARHDPARVLAECEAKRRIVAWMSDWQNDVAIEGLRILALPYATHDLFQEEWNV